MLGLPGQRAGVDSAAYQQALRVVRAHYYGSIDSTKLTQGSIKGMVDGLGDPFTAFYTPQQFQQQQQGLAGHQKGVIGVNLTFSGDYPQITSVLPGSPAQRAGLQAQDVVTAIDGQDARGLTAQKASTLIRGAAGSSVRLDLLRAGVAVEVTVDRESFTSPTVVSRRLEGDVLYIRVYQFGNATASEFDSQLRAGLPGARGVVLDLRENPGGLVDAAAAVLSEFIEGGELFEVRDRSGAVTRRSPSGDHPGARVPLVVVVDANSASASEIVAGSLQERGRARLVGTKTFGKGSVQEDYRLQDGSDLHLTVEHWFLPNGRSVIGDPLLPDVGVTLAGPGDMYDVVSPAVGLAGDGQLKRALELVGAS